MSTTQEVSQCFYVLFELDLEEHEDYENVQEIIHNLMILIVTLIITILLTLFQLI